MSDASDAAARREQAEERRREAQERYREARSAAGIPTPLSNDFPNSEAVERESLPNQTIDEEAFGSPHRMNLFAGLCNLVSRVSDHLARIDSGVFYAVDDLAVALRVLLHRGTGSGILLEAIKEFGIESPPVLFSEPPPTDCIFGVGSIPFTEYRDGFETEKMVIGSIEAWLNHRVLIVDFEDEPREISWRKFLGDYPNKLGGAHLDRRKVPTYLELMDWYGAADLSLSGYLLRVAGVMTWHSTQHVICELVKSLGFDVPDGYIFGSAGSDFQPPEDLYERGMLSTFGCNNEGMALTWFVDDNSLNRLRLYYDGAAWDYTHTADGWTVDKHADPVSEYLFQSPRNPAYPAQMMAGVYFKGTPFFHLPRIRTWRDLDEGIDHEFPADFNPLRAGPGWQIAGENDWEQATLEKPPPSLRRYYGQEEAEPDPDEPAS